jgi:hypothetical protein
MYVDTGANLYIKEKRREATHTKHWIHASSMMAAATFLHAIT